MRYKIKNMSALKKLTILAVVIFSIFAGINLFWIYTKALPYQEYISTFDIDPNSFQTLYTKEIGLYRYRIRKPSYLGYNDFLSVCSTKPYIVETDSDGNAIKSSGLYVTLYIWPNAFGGYKYGLFFEDDAQDIFEQAYIDENMNYLPRETYTTEVNERIEKLMAQKHDEISGMMQGAKNTWGLQGGNAMSGLNKYLKSASAPIQLGIAAAVVISVILLVNLLWVFRKRRPFNGYTRELNRFRENGQAVYRREVDGYLYTVRMPDYLRSNGYLSIRKCDKNISKDEQNIRLFIYPHIKKNGRYALSFGRGEKEKAERVTINSDAECMMDGKGGVEVNKKIVNMISDNYKLIKDMISEAKQFWGIDAVKD